MAGWTTLVQAETLAMALSRADLVVIDCRFTLLDPNAGEQAYQSSHLPGASYAHLERDLSDMTPSGDGRHPWPSVKQIVDRLARWGIGPTSQVIVYDYGDGAIAARLWFLLRMLGCAGLAGFVVASHDGGTVSRAIRRLQTGLRQRSPIRRR